MKTLNEMFRSKNELLMKYLTVNQTICLWKMCTKPLSHVDIEYWQCYNELINTTCVTFLPFFIFW